MTQDSSGTATPAASGDGSTALVLVPPDPVPAVSDTQAAQQASNIDPATAKQLDATVASYVDALTTLDPHSTDFDSKMQAIHNLGDADIRQSAEVSNRLLQRPAAAMETGGLSQSSSVSTGLVQLRRTVEDLDPTKQGLFHEGKLLGFLPFGNKLRDYFHKYESSQANLNAIINSLYRGQDELEQDNASLEQEKANIWAVKGRLEQYIYMANQLDGDISAKVTALQTSDPDRAKALQEDVLFYVRQKRQDLLTQLAVNMQGYLALDLVRRNNLELIKGVDRATTTTVSALRTAIIVAQALTNQKLVLNQINVLNTTTSNLIESTSEMLREQTGQVYEQAAGSTIQLDKLQAAFNNIYATMDAIDTYKLSALDNMKQTIDALNTEVAKAQQYLQRAQTEQAAQSNDLALPSGSTTAS